jgi:lycopene beta-cyclase
MKNESFDIIIIGGGLSGLLSLIVLQSQFPHLKILVLEKNAELSQSHTWCFHEADLPPGTWSWLKNYVTKSWKGYEVRFPTYTRKLNSPYHALVSKQFTALVLEKFKENIRFNAQVLNSTDSLVQLSPSEVLHAELVIDASGWPQIPKDRVAYQKFVGLDVELEQAHGLESPILKDVTLPQTDGYRFIYTLPWSETSCLIEDTYYSNSPHLDEKTLTQDLENYARSQGWKIKKINRVEVGCLPLALYNLSASSHYAIGAKSLCFNPVTGYTLPQTLALMQKFYDMKTASKDEILAAILTWKTELNSQTKYLRLLNRMMFLIAKPHLRYKILERFYALDEGLIHRFYGTRLSFRDKLRILSGKPPVNPFKALTVLSDKK